MRQGTLKNLLLPMFLQFPKDQPDSLTHTHPASFAFIRRYQKIVTVRCIDDACCTYCPLPFWMTSSNM